MNVLSPEAERTNKDVLCLCVISVLMAGGYPAFISPPQVNARPIHALFREHSIVRSAEVFQNSDSDRATRERNVRRSLLLENLYEMTSNISGNARDDVGFVGLDNEGAVRHRLGLRHERESLRHHVAVDNIGVEPTQLFSEAVAQRGTTQRDIVCGLPRLLEPCHLVIVLRQDDVADSTTEDNTVNGTIIRNMVGQLKRNRDTESERKPRGQQLTTRGARRHRHRNARDGIVWGLVEHGGQLRAPRSNARPCEIGVAGRIRRRELTEAGHGV